MYSNHLTNPIKNISTHAQLKPLSLNLQLILLYGNKHIPFTDNIHTNDITNSIQKLEKQLHKHYQRDLELTNIIQTNQPLHIDSTFYAKTPFTPINPDTARQHPDLQKYLINLKNAVTLDNNIDKPHHTIPYTQPILKQTIKHTLNELDKRPEIHIANTDKNLGPIIMDLTHYHSLVLQELNQTCYTTVTPDKIPPNSQFKNELTNIIHKHNIKPNSGISQYILQDIPTNEPPQLAYIYLLIKIHKQKLPTDKLTTRPVISQIKTNITYAAKFINTILQPIDQRLPTYLKDSATLINTINSPDFQLPPNPTFLSYDITALYPSIDTTHAIPIIHQTLFNDYLHLIPNFTNPIPHSQATIDDINFICDLLQYLLTHNYFTYNDITKLQTNGTAIGSPLATPYANIYVFYIIKLAIQSLITKFNLPPTTTTDNIFSYHKRFVDDGLLLYNNNLPFTPEDIQTALNSIHPSMQYTITSGHTIDYMDITLSITNNNTDNTPTLNTNIYTKPVNQHLYITPYTNHPPTTITNIPYNEFRRAKLICSTTALYNTASNNLHTWFTSRHYNPNDLTIAEAKVPSRTELIRLIKPHNPPNNFPNHNVNTQPPFPRFITPYNTNPNHNTRQALKYPPHIRYSYNYNYFPKTQPTGHTNFKNLQAIVNPSRLSKTKQHYLHKQNETQTPLTEPTNNHNRTLTTTIQTSSNTSSSSSSSTSSSPSSSSSSTHSSSSSSSRTSSSSSSSSSSSPSSSSFPHNPPPNSHSFS
jgi:hypothetical protein